MEPASPLRTALADRYSVVREVGAGGMATVYLVRDHRHERDLALKVLRPELATLVGPDRFLREIHFAAQLQHPNIVPLIDSGEAGGYLYYLMPYIEGETLRARIAAGPMPPAEAVRIAVQIAGALRYAHRKGILHRDIKPENILLAEGHAFVADFGIGRAIGSAGDRLTQTGFALGTPAYMAPEQVVAPSSLDERADLFALGSVLFEMVTGELPFGGETPEAAMVRRFTDPAPSLGARRPDAPEWLDRLVAELLARDPADRPAGAGEVLERLERGAAGTATSAASEPAEIAVAVLPFANQSADPDDAYLGDGITDELITDLARVPGLRVTSRTSSMRLKGADRPVSSIARELGVRYVVDGAVRRVGGLLQLTAQVVDAVQDRSIWGDKFRGGADALLDLQDALCRSVLRALPVSGPAPRRAADERMTDPGAYDCYLRARHEMYQFREDALRRANALLARGLELAPEHPLLLAAAGMVEVHYVNLGLDPEGRHTREARRCLHRLRDAAADSAGVHQLAGLLEIFAEHCDPRLAVREFFRAAELSPSDPDPLLWLGVYGPELAPVDAVRDAVDRMAEIDPLTPMSLGVRGWPAVLEGDAERAERAVAAMVEGDSENPLHLWGAGIVLPHCGRLDQAIAHLDALVRAAPASSVRQSGLVMLRALRGDRAEALEALTPALVGLASRDSQMAWALASSLAHAGAEAEALDWLERAIDRGFVNYPFLARRDRHLALLRRNPRFLALMDRARAEYERSIVEFLPAADRERHFEEVRAVARDLRAAAAAPASPDRRSVAVLPFVNLGRDPDNEHLSDGVTEDTITQLSRIRSLKVIARSSVMRFKGSTRPPAEIARALGVATLLEGSVQRSGDRIRIAAKLIDPRTDELIWAETYDRHLTDIFEVQSNVARSIAAALAAQVTPGETAALEHERVGNLEAYNLCLLGRHHFNRFTPDDFFKGIECFRRAAALDPGNARAEFGWGLCLGALALGYWPVDANYWPEAKPHLERRSPSTPGWPTRMPSSRCSRSSTSTPGLRPRRSSGTPWTSIRTPRWPTTCSPRS